MTYNILDIYNYNEWESYLLKFSKEQQDISYSPGYYQLCEEQELGKANCFIYSENNNLVVYPFLVNSINKLGYELDQEYFDIQGAYGYNGPLINTKDEKFIKNFENIFCQFCKESNIVAEFTRFNPLLNNHEGLKYINPIYTNDVINVDLSASENEIWSKSYISDIRRIIKKGREQGYIAKVILLEEASKKEINDFILIYHLTMKRNSANPFYFFSEDYFHKMKKIMPENFLLGLVYHNGTPVGASINPFNAKNAYGFLGGSLKEYQKVSPFTYLTHHVILEFKKLGMTNFMMGGGITRGDNIFKYKKGFSREGVKDFYIGKKNHIPEVYNIVINQWMSNFPESYANNKSKLLGYREIEN